jgi:pilus assembly protein CpaB
MNASRIILLVVALVAGGLAAFLATRGSAPPPAQTRTQVVEEQKVKVLVAKDSIGVAQRLTRDAIEWQDWPELAVRPEYITQAAFPDALTEMNDAVARFEIFAGEPVTDLKLVRSDQGYLSAVLEKGMRGVSVPVRADAAAGGFVVPNDRVDVVLTREGISQTILANVKILAIGTRLGQVNTAKKNGEDETNAAEVRTFTGGTIATLELTPEQGELIINATRLGSLSVVLRSIADFAQAPGDAIRNETSRAIKMIRFGTAANVMPSDGGSAPVTVTDAAFEQSAEESLVEDENIVEDGADSEEDTQ